MSDTRIMMQGMEAIIQVFTVLYVCSGKGRKKEECCLRNDRSPFPGPKEFGLTHAYIIFIMFGFGIRFGISYV